MNLDACTLLARAIRVGACFTLSGLTVAAQSTSGAAAPSARPSRSPTTFIENRGQWDGRALFAARTEGADFWIVKDGLLLEGAGADARLPSLVSLRFEDAEPSRISGKEAGPTQYAFFHGSDPARWRSHVPGWHEVQFDDAWPGIDVLLHSSGSTVQYDFVLRPGANPKDIVLHVEGANFIELGPDGSLLISTPEGIWSQTPPRSWDEDQDGAQVPVASAYVLLGDGRVGVRVEGHSSNRPLVIDPGIEWASFLGGSGELLEETDDLAISSTGSVIVVGSTRTLDFPLKNPIDATTDCETGSQLCREAFISRFSPDGSQLEFSTFLGGNNADFQPQVALASDESIVLCGITVSVDFPVTPGALGSAGAVPPMIFVSRLSPDGQSLDASAVVNTGCCTFDVRGVALTPEEDVVVVGGGDGDMPVTPGAFDTTHDLNLDGVILRFDKDFTKIVSGTYLGGSSSDHIEGVLIEPDGSIVTVGTGSSKPGFPPATPGAFDETPKGIYVARFTPDLSAITQATFIGNTIGGSAANAIARGPDGRLVLTGITYGFDFPTTPGAFQSTGPSGSIENGFISGFSPDLSKLLFSSYLYGSSVVWPSDVDVDNGGAVTVSGSTSGAIFPTTKGCYDATLGGATDTFLVRFTPQVDKLVYGTFIGGSSPYLAVGRPTPLDVDATGSAVTAWNTGSRDAPATPESFQPVLNGASDTFVAKLDLLPYGVSRHGTSTPGSLGPLVLGVLDQPKVGSTTFGITCSGAPPSSNHGILVVGLDLLAQPVPLVGAQLWVDPATLLLLVPLHSTPWSWSELRAQIPDDPLSLLIGLTFAVQAFWQDAAGPAGVSASHALQIELQP